MSTAQKIYAAGHRGMVGSAMVRQLQSTASVIPGSTRDPSHPIVKIDPRYFRPTEFETLLGNPSKAKLKKGWVPEITAQEMCVEMVAADLARAKQHALLRANGFNVNVSLE